MECMTVRDLTLGLRNRGKWYCERQQETAHMTSTSYVGFEKQYHGIRGRIKA